MSPVPRTKPYIGPAILGYGFRPFFLAGSIVALIAIALWIPQYSAVLVIPTVLPPPSWHAHEMLFGFIPAVVTGFLLTAVPNWTGRLPLQGAPLAFLLLLWLAGRAAIALSPVIGWAAAMAIDCAYLLALGCIVAREIIAGRNWRNLRVLALVALMCGANIAFHLEVHFTGASQYSERGGLAAIIILVVLIGGRIIPSFTRNWLAKNNPGPLPTSADRLDAALAATAAIGVISWVASPVSRASAALLLVAAIGQAIRLMRWVGWRAWRDPLVTVLHLAYLFIPVGFVFHACAALHRDHVPPAAGVHAWAIGAISGMILAVMTRATLGHTGRALQASRGTLLVYLSIGSSALTRIAAALIPEFSYQFLLLSTAAWIAAFAGFAAVYGPYLASPRRKPNP